MKKVSISDELADWADAYGEARGIPERGRRNIITSMALTGYLSQHFSKYKKNKEDKIGKNTSTREGRY